MKNLTVFALILAFFQIGNAQEEIKTNTFVLGGSIYYYTQDNAYPSTSFAISPSTGSFYSSNASESKNSNFRFSPYLGKNLNANWLLGVQLSYQANKYTAKDVDYIGQLIPIDIERNSNQLGFGLFGRYVVNPANALNFYLQPYVSYNTINEDNLRNLSNSTVTDEAKTNYVQAGISVGMLYNINHKWRATLRFGGINYVNGFWKEVGTETKNDFSSFRTNFGLSSLSLGFEWKF